mgnify:CR=1 FL=1
MENARLVSLLVVLLSLLALACGGDDADRRRTTPDWEPSQRVPTSSERWWAEPVERYCGEDRECRQEETCQQVRLGTCPRCPRGEDARICVGETEEPRARARR